MFDFFKQNKIQMAVSISFLFLFSLFLVVLQPWSIIATTAADVLAPILSPIFEDVCNDVKCGKGVCKPSNNSAIPYECECSPGWKQLSNDDDDDDDDDNRLKFLPCVIPNCTINSSCSEAAPPIQDKENRGNESIFDVCRWTDCGGGKCESTSLLTHKCECNEGYHNLLNLTFSPCFRECSLGLDCKDLNIGFMNKSTPPPPPPSSSADRSNQANFGVEGRFNWLIFILAVLGSC